MRVWMNYIVLTLVLIVGLGTVSRAETPIGVGLAPVNDWSTQQPFLDVMKTARRWIGHRPNQWGGMDHKALEELGVLDDQGWPTHIPDELRSIGTVILTDIPGEAEIFAGRYRLRFEGVGIVEVAGRAFNVRYGKGEVSFDFAPGPGPVEVRIQRTDPQNYIRNISIVKLEHAASFDLGATFHPTWLAQLEGLKSLRFMDWTNTNDSDQADWLDRPQIDDFSYSWRGVPVEVMVKLANRTGADPWFNMPHLSDDTYSRKFAELVRDTLYEEQKVYVEFSNEVWNWQFLQAEWADTKARDRWGQNHRGAQFYGMRAAEVATEWGAVFAENRDRLINVVATQTGWLGLEADILKAPLWVAENPSENRPPFEAFDAYAVTGYFGHFVGTDKFEPVVSEWLNESREAARTTGQSMGLSGDALDEYIQTHRFDQAIGNAHASLVDGDAGDTVADMSGRIFPYHKAVADKYNLNLIMYEGGTHVVGTGAQLNNPEFSEFFVALNYAPEMGRLYELLLDGWVNAGGGMFNAYNDVQTPGKWGSWGALRYLGDTTPRWSVLERYK